MDNHDIKDLIYLQVIVKETLRLYPPGPLSVPHEAMEDCHVCGYYVPKGTRAFVNVWKLHRDPRVWENPEELLLERFLTSHASIDASGQHFEFIPFGSGRRICAGLPLAEKTLMYILASLLHSFEWKLPHGTELEFSDNFGIVTKKLNPTVAVPTPRLSNFELYTK